MTAQTRSKPRYRSNTGSGSPTLDSNATPERWRRPHEPEILSNDNLLICLQHDTPHQVVEIDRDTGEVVWEFFLAGLRTTRDSDRLPNSNTLIQAVLMTGDDSVVLEVTPDGQIVWELKFKDTPAPNSPGWFYKAERVCQE